MVYNDDTGRAIITKCVFIGRLISFTRCHREAEPGIFSYEFSAGNPSGVGVEKFEYTMHIFRLEIVERRHRYTPCAPGHPGNIKACSKVSRSR